MRRDAVAWAAGALATLVLAGCGAATSGATRPDASRARTGATAPAATASLASSPALIPPRGAPPRSVTVPVLTFHRVHTLPAVGEPDLIVDPATFLAELRALKAAGYHTIRQYQLFDALYKGTPLPPKPVLISADDGYVDDVRTMLPDLLRLHMVATFFVITGRIHEPGFLDPAQIRQLDRAGMDVGDHTADHVDLTLQSPARLYRETAGSRRALQAILGHPVYTFAYPFGAYNPTVEQALRTAGFTLAYTTRAGTTESTAAPLALPRLHVGRSETPAGLLALLADPSIAGSGSGE